MSYGGSPAAWLRLLRREAAQALIQVFVMYELPVRVVLFVGIKVPMEYSV